MIRQLTISYFKSIGVLNIACRKVNLFIGPPDTGKTNILEALHVLSRLGWALPLDTSLRLSQQLKFDPLFHRQFFNLPIVIKLDDTTCRIAIEGQERQLKIQVKPHGRSVSVGFGATEHMPELDWIRYYSYADSAIWRYGTGGHRGTELVTPPHGTNLTYIARHNAKVYDFLKETVSALNWKLRFDQNERKFLLSEVRQDEILDYNLELLSDSVKRLFFYGAILLTSESSTLVLDEPDVYAFPPYPKTLAEMIAADRTNQFFLTTHNPYFLAGIVEKTPVDDLALFVCDRDPENGTSARMLTVPEVQQVIEQGANVFFNLDKFSGSPK